MAEEKKAPNKVLGIVALVLALLAGVVTMLMPDNFTGALIVCIIGLLFALVAIILGFVGLKGNKVCAIIGIIFGFLNLAFAGLALVGILGIAKATDCEETATKGVYTCTLMGQKLENVPGGLLNDNQKKK